MDEFDTKESRRQHHVAARSPYDPALLEQIQKESLGTFGGYELRLVDAAEVRNWLDVDFVEGGNPARYGYVPMTEIWVDRSNMAASPLDGMAIALHEACEGILMEKHGLDYDRAHECANVAERAARTAYRESPEPLASPEAAFAEARAKNWLREYGQLAFDAAAAAPEPLPAPEPQEQPNAAAQPSAEPAEDDGMGLDAWARRAY